MGLEDTPGIGSIFKAVSQLFRHDNWSPNGEKTHVSRLRDRHPTDQGVQYSEAYEPDLATQRDEWMVGGRLHREGAPAVTETDLKTGVVTLEQYWTNNRLNRTDGGPAVIERDGDTGKVLWEEWRKDGQKHRENGLPSGIGYGQGDGNRDPKTGAPLHQYWYVNGKNIAPPDVMPQQTPCSPEQTPGAPATAAATTFPDAPAAKTPRPQAQ